MSNSKPSLMIYGWLSIAAALITITLKTYAYLLTDSVSLLSDAMESLINLVAAIIVLVVLKIAAKPADDDHAYGHEKIEYFSSGAEGILILLAAISIVMTAWQRLWQPVPLQSLDWGLLISIVASLINGLVAWVLIRAGKQHRSLALEADGRHLLTDVWTTLGIIAGIGLIELGHRWPQQQGWTAQLGWQDWNVLDPIIAILVAVNIVWAGLSLIKRTFSGLMDEALVADERAEIISVLDAFVQSDGIDYHALRTRYAGSRRFMSVHILVPGQWSVQQGHDLLETIEQAIEAKFSAIDIDTHLEPLEDSASFQHLHCKLG